MRFIILIGLLTFTVSSYSQDCKICGIYDEQVFYRYAILELKENNDYTFHIMTWFDHVKTKGRYKIENDSIIFEQLQGDSIELKQKRYSINKKEIDLEYWHLSKTNKYKEFNSIPFEKSDLHLFVNSLIIDSLGFTNNIKSYKGLLYLIVREPTYPQKPLIILNDKPIKYMFELDFYNESQLIDYNILDSTMSIVHEKDTIKPYSNGFIRLITKPELIESNITILNVHNR